VSELTLDSPVADIDRRLAQRRMGVRTKGPPAAEVLAAAPLGIETVGQLLRHYPRRYIDRSATAPIGQLRINQYATVIGKVRQVTSRRMRNGRPMVTVKVYDGTGFLDVVFFNQPWTASQYREGMELAVSGTATRYARSLQMAKQEVEILRGAEVEMVHMGRITPVHPAVENISTRTIRELVHGAVRRLPHIPDPIPAEIIGPENLLEEDSAIRYIHFPEDDAILSDAAKRLKFDELFALELGVAFRKHRLARTAKGQAHDGQDLVDRFVRDLPFRATVGQERAIAEVSLDMQASSPMNRLLQGDVGSGKTVVALAAAMRAIGSGHQATIMAPTEVLAAQHVRTTGSLLAPLGAVNVSAGGSARRRSPAVAKGQGSLLGDADGEPAVDDSAIRYALLTASVTGRERQAVLEGIADGSIDLVIGTHALVQEGVEFADLSLAVIDEQHRFGVHQRLTLKEKGAHPDVLIMTATPIPRTLALTYYGDLDVSVLDELPAGRRPVRTTVAHSPEAREAAYELVRTEVAAGRQAFVVCAAIDEANRAEVRAAEAEAERLRTAVFPDLRVELLHGKMRPTDKEAAMERFRAGGVDGADVLVATTVVEVGVDVPNATVMLVENAERFGLAQLHQLRGRIGRGAHQSYCVLFDVSHPENVDAHVRMEAMARSSDGFELADVDLRQRGEGTLFDVKQSGMPDLRLARLPEDVDLVRRARARAFAVIDADPELAVHPRLLQLLHDSFSGEAIDWLFHS
jgi:ATP-dependent DNA helicase RecG